MNRTRWIALAVVVAVLAVSGAAYGLAGGGGDDGAATAGDTTSTTERRRSTTSSSSSSSSTSSTTTTTAPPKPAAPVDDGSLKQGSSGPAVLALQQRLIELKFDPGPADGRFGLATTYAVQGFQKLNGLGPDGRVGPQVQAALANPATPTPLVPDGGATRVEVDLRKQLLFLYKDGAIRLITHVSTGNNKTYCVDGSCNNKAVTPIGAFKFAWRYSGWRQSRLGKLYNPVYFTSSGVAVHGALSVPTYPASHGCVRIPMHIAEYFPSLVRKGDAVYVTDGRAIAPHPQAPTGPPPSDPPTTPGDDTTTTTTTTAPPQDTTTTTSTTAPSQDSTTTTTSTTTPTTTPTTLL
jgi:lipoprotein-anchoring transpeptidase ErfK/SrfK